MVCPLDWGLGHATRCVPIINALIGLGHEIIIAADNSPLSFLKATFPQLKSVKMLGYPIRYSIGSMHFKMLSQIPGFLKSIKKEHQMLQKMIDEYKIDLVISDNRYGCWSEKVPSVFITHQLFIQAPFGKKWLNKINHHFIKKFDECWVPDVKGSMNLSGNLVHEKPLPAIKHFFMGSLSRFADSEKLVTAQKYDVMVIISGPEPQRTVFESLIAKQAEKTALKLVLVRGLPSETKIPTYLQSENIEVHNHLSTAVFLKKISQSNLVVSRAGYSTIMDLAVWGKKAVLVPTPGQTEQEYLATYHFEKQHFFTQHQQEFDLEKAIKTANNYSGIQIQHQFDLSKFLEERIGGMKK